MACTVSKRGAGIVCLYLLTERDCEYFTLVSQVCLAFFATKYPLLRHLHCNLTNLEIVSQTKRLVGVLLFWWELLETFVGSCFRCDSSIYFSFIPRAWEMPNVLVAILGCSCVIVYWMSEITSVKSRVFWPIKSPKRCPRAIKKWERELLSSECLVRA